MRPDQPAGNGRREATANGYLRQHATAFALSIVVTVVAIGGAAGVIVGFEQHSIGWGLLSAGLAGCFFVMIGIIVMMISGFPSRYHTRKPD
jgi:FtsH-binding integral membrane protein